MFMMIINITFNKSAKFAPFFQHRVHIVDLYSQNMDPYIADMDPNGQDMEIGPPTAGYRKTDNQTQKRTDQYTLLFGNLIGMPL